MANLRFQDEITFEKIDFPLGRVRIELEVELTTADVPEVAYQRYVADVLQRLAQHAAEGRALVSANGAAKPAVAPTPAAAKKAAVAQEAEAWTVPNGLHLKTVKSAHRFLVAATSLVERGPAPTLGEVGEKAKMSGPPIAKIANPATDAGQYIAPLVQVTKKGRSKVVDVTPLGRKVASLVRAGKLPS